MLIWGISALGHDASIGVVADSGEILFASQAERYSRVKNDSLLNDQIVEEALSFGRPNCIVWYEKAWKRRLRCLYSGQFQEALSIKNSPQRYIQKWPELAKLPFHSVGHHASHAAAGYYTSPFREALILVVDAIGEWDVASIWRGEGSKIEKVTSWSYPNSLGLLYSAFTQRVGLKPNEEEYILMGMAAYGKPRYVNEIRREFFNSKFLLSFRRNPHIGVDEFLPDAKNEDLAASIQQLLEEELVQLLKYAKKVCPSENLVYMGGVALNCLANTKIFETELFNRIWIMPNPGDGGSSLGAAAFHMQTHLKWDSPYLGHRVKGAYPVVKLLNELLSSGIVGVANGAAELGPRALGARSLLADPRSLAMKDRVNQIKQRQNFRPFGPVVLAEEARKWFDLPWGTDPYMQFVGKCLRSQDVPAICHFDQTSRVQTLSREQHPGLHELLSKWYEATGCPILLNTSLNIKGEPLVNSEDHALAFAKKYGVKVFTS